MDLKERFLKYVSYDTQSSEESTTFPSTEKQKVLLAALRDAARAAKAGDYVAVQRILGPFLQSPEAAALFGGG